MTYHPDQHQSVRWIESQSSGVEPGPADTALFLRTDSQAVRQVDRRRVRLDIAHYQPAPKQFLDTAGNQQETCPVADWLGGTWKLIAWRRIAADETVSYPLGTDARGQLIYTMNGRMAVHIVGADRPPLATDDPLGGDMAARAGAYSTYLAYFGTYELDGTSVVHHVDGSLFPNWSGEKQVRPFTIDGDELVLRTPPMPGDDGGTVVNELAWTRDES
jgi:hypothetical protein